MIYSAAFADRVGWFANTAGDGSTWSQIDISSSATLASAVDLGDIDGDGTLDVLSAAAGDDTLFVLQVVNMPRRTLAMGRETAPDFEDHLSVQAIAPLSEQHRPTVLQLDRHRSQHHHRRKQDKAG